MYRTARPYLGLVIGISLVAGACGGAELDLSVGETGKAEVLNEHMVHGMNTSEESWAFSISKNTIQASCAAGTVVMKVEEDKKIIYTAYDTEDNRLGETHGWQLRGDSVETSFGNYTGDKEGKQMILGFVEAMKNQFGPDEEMAKDLNSLLTSYQEGDVEGVNEWLNKNSGQNVKRLLMLTGTIMVAGMVGIALPGLGAVAFAAGLAIIVESIYGMFLMNFGTGDGPVPDLIHLGSCDPRNAECALEPMFEVMI